MSVREWLAAKELFYFLAWKEIKVRYKQTFLGVAWALLQPLLTMTLFTLLFSSTFPSPAGAPYSLFALAGLIPWIYISAGVNFSSTCLIGEANMIKKVHFPLIALPLSKIFAGLLDLMISFALFLIFAMALSYPLSPKLLLFPLWMGFAFVAAAGPALYLSALTALYRDVRYVIPFLIQVWMFASPIAYPSTLIQEKWLSLYCLNPLVCVIELFRWMALGEPLLALLPLSGWVLSASSTLLFFLYGLYFFRQTELELADVL